MSTAARDYAVDTPQGPGRFVVDEATRSDRLLVLGHGAGGGVGALHLELLARGLPELGTTVARFEQPWRTAGGKVAGRPATLDVAWLAALSWLAAQPWAAVPLVVGGRSAGARVACRTASTVGAVGVVCLAFPLHPPGAPDRSRAPELVAPIVPRLVLQGTRDAFGGPDEIRAAVGPDPLVRVVDLPGADHGFRVPAAAAFTAADLAARLLAAVAAFVAEPAA